MTEEEAKAKWCPFARAISGKMLPDGSADAPAVQATFNRVAVGPTQHMTPNVAKCIGSACMVWREEDEEEYGERCMGWAADVQQGADATGGPPKRHGFCGLAGKP